LLSVLSGNSTLALRAGFAFPVRGLALSQCHSGQAPVYALKIPYHVIDAWNAAVVQAPVSVQLDQPPMPPGAAHVAPPAPQPYRAAAVSKPKEPSEAMADKTKPRASAATDAVAARAENPEEKIILVTQQGIAYIKEEGNKRKGQGMTTDELIEKTEERSEKMHERMVDVARDLREEERRLHQLEKEALVHTEGTPERERLNYLVERARKSVDDFRFLLNICRTALDSKNSVLEKLKGDE
jgi:hypothetical protein